MAVNFDGTVGCLGIAKALEIGRSPRSGCTCFVLILMLNFIPKRRN